MDANGVRWGDIIPHIATTELFPQNGSCLTGERTPLDWENTHFEPSQWEPHATRPLTGGGKPSWETTSLTKASSGVASISGVTRGITQDTVCPSERTDGMIFHRVPMVASYMSTGSTGEA